MVPISIEGLEVSRELGSRSGSRAIADVGIRRCRLIDEGTPEIVGYESGSNR